MEIYGTLIVPTSSLLECVDATEYLALSATEKDVLRIILSVGSVNMGAGSKIRTMLATLFPSGVTHDAIAAQWSVL
jgi:hypothetical protein